MFEHLCQGQRLRFLVSADRHDARSYCLCLVPFLCLFGGMTVGNGTWASCLCHIQC